MIKMYTVMELNDALKKKSSPNMEASEKINIIVQFLPAVFVHQHQNGVYNYIFHIFYCLQ